MSTPDKPDIVGWFGLRRVADWSGARWLGPLLSAVMIALFVMAVMVVGAVLLHALVGLPLDAPRIGFGTGAVAVAVIGAPFVIWRAVVAQKTVSVQEQGQITDRINKAVEGLGAEKEVSAIGRPVTLYDDDPALQVSPFTEVDRNQTVIEWQGKSLHIPNEMFVRHEGDWQVFTETVPNLEVRLGAIYALERIAQDSERDHVQIMEILCAYVRENSGREDLSLPEGEPTPRRWVDWASKKLQRPRLDVDTALTVVSRRSEARRQHEREKGYRLELEEVSLPLTVMRFPDLSSAQFFKADMQGIFFGNMKLNGANFLLARLQAACFFSTDLKGTDFTNAELNGAFFTDGEMDAETKFKNASLEGAAIRGTNLKHVEQIAEHLEVTFGDGSVTPPEGCDPPIHWEDRELELKEFRAAWREWLAQREGHEPPQETGG